MKENKPSNPKKMNPVRLLIIISATLLLLLIWGSSLNSNSDTSGKQFSDFVTSAKHGEISSIAVQKRSSGDASEIQVTPKEGAEYTVNGDVSPDFLVELSNNNIKVAVAPEEKPSMLRSFLFSVFPVLLLIGAMVWLTFGNKSGGIMKATKSKAQLIDPKDITVTFDDVKGCDEAKLEAKEIVDFLKSPEKFKKLGANIPRGLLLIGPPGTGKTLIASAIAKEAGVPYLAVAGSEFVEMFVGVGAARVREMFDLAKKNAPCIIFIDEIDSIAGSRGGPNNNEERESTLNQILVEMDGLKNGQKDIIVIGATNMADKLDKALRPGRFDRRIYVDLPDVKGREEILKLYVKNTPLDPNVDLRKLALYTAGLAGAELKNVVNEACILAAREDSKTITQRHLQEGYDKMSMGVERKNNALSDEAKMKTAYHEAGHAVVSMMLENHMALHKVTIIPRGKSLGLTRFLPEEDKMYSMQREEIIDQITSTLGGRAAEMLFVNTLTSGASHDIQVATLYARNMVTKYGMSKIGPVAYNSNNENNGYGFNMFEMSESNRKAIEDEVVSIIKSCEERARTILEDNKDLVIRMTTALMEMETIDAPHIYNLKNNKHPLDAAGMEEYYKLNEEKEKEKFAKLGIDVASVSEVVEAQAVAVDNNENNDDNDSTPKKTFKPTEFTEKEFKRRTSIFDLLGLKKPA